MKVFFLQVLCVSLAKWVEIAQSQPGSHPGSQAQHALLPGLSWAADLGVLEFDGQEAAKFLQGYLTCDTEALGAERWQPTALCNLQGRVVANGWVCADPNGSLWLLVHHSLAEPCLAFLHKYLVFAKAQGHNRSEEIVALIGVQQAAPDNLHALALLPEVWLGLAKLDQAIALWQNLPTPAPNSQLNTALISAGLALVSADSSEQYLPQMLGLASSGAIDFDKGCYLGQEIVARAQHRGAVKRQLVRLEWPQPKNFETDNLDWSAAELTNAQNKTVGKIINWLVASNGNQGATGRALAVINSKAGELPPELTATAASTSSQNPEETAAATSVFQVNKIEN